jgi:hypothetical protein
VDTYAVEEAAGASHTAARLQLRQRVFVKQAHAGVTGDKKTTGITLFFALSKSAHIFHTFPFCGAAACGKSSPMQWRT